MVRGWQQVLLQYRPANCCLISHLPIFFCFFLLLVCYERKPGRTSHRTVSKIQNFLYFVVLSRKFKLKQLEISLGYHNKTQKPNQNQNHTKRLRILISRTENEIFFMFMLGFQKEGLGELNGRKSYYESTTTLYC